MVLLDKTLLPPGQSLPVCITDDVCTNTFFLLGKTLKTDTFIIRHCLSIDIKMVSVTKVKSKVNL